MVPRTINNMETKIAIVCVIFLFDQLSGSLGQKVTLYPFRQRDSISTCTHGLLHRLDTVVFRCSVDFLESSPLNTLLAKIMKNGSTFRHHTSYNLTRQCLLGSSTVCRRFKGRIFLNFLIEVEATMDLNGAVLHAAAYSADPRDEISDEQDFPDIYDVNDTKGRLLVNGKEMLTTEGSRCEAEVIGPFISVLYECQSPATPCIIEISSTNTDKISQGENVAVFNTDSSVPLDLNVTIKYDLCGYDEHSKSATCRIIVNLGSDALCGWQVIIASFVTVVLVLLAQFVWGKRYSFLKHLKKLCLFFYKWIQENNTPELCDATETEVLVNSESSILNKNSCEKYKGHDKKFVSLRHFNMDSLPATYQDGDLFQLVKVTFDLTVKIFVSKNSNRRPRYYPNTKKPFPFYNRNEMGLKVGTGIIWNLVKCKKKENIQCKCDDCKHSQNPKKVIGVIKVATAAQLVFDKFEAKSTTIDIDINGQTLSFVGFKAEKIDVVGDFVICCCRTCQEDVFDRLKAVKNNWIELFKKVEKKMKKGDDIDTFSFMVSHPHGDEKVVSFGHWVHRSVDPGFTSRTKYTYTTPSCPGSSGAFVFLMDQYEHVHCGVNRDGINFSSTSNYSSFESPLKKLHVH